MTAERLRTLCPTTLQITAEAQVGGTETAPAVAPSPGAKLDTPDAQGGKTSSGPLDLRRQVRVVRFTAVRAPGGVSAVFGDDQGRFRQFHLLECSRCSRVFGCRRVPQSGQRSRR